MEIKPNVQPRITNYISTMTAFTDDTIPYFAWDRPLTVGNIRGQLCTGSEEERQSLAAWIMREAAFRDVWQFLSPEQVDAMFPSIEHRLGRKREFWAYILKAWHELGKL